MFSPLLYQGALGLFHVRELAETGILTTSVKFSVDEDVREGKGHVSESAIDQILQTRTITRGLIIDFEGEIIQGPDGQARGLGKVWAGQNIATCAHFAPAVGETPAQLRLGYTRDPAKLLQVREATMDLTPDNPAALKFQAKYFPYIDHDAASAA